MPDLTAERLRQILHYDPITGVFTWIDCGKAGLNGTTAGADNRGWIQIQIEGQIYNAHRLAWFYVHGEWPPRLLDHENRNRADNRIGNLRLATKSQNAANSGVSTNNTSGSKGVSFHKRSCKWRAYITVEGKTTHLGLFVDPNDAAAAYTAAAAKYFGDFARVA